MNDIQIIDHPPCMTIPTIIQERVLILGVLQLNTHIARWLARLRSSTCPLSSSRWLKTSARRGLARISTCHRCRNECWVGPRVWGSRYIWHMCILHELVEHSISLTSDIEWQLYDVPHGMFVEALQYKRSRRNRWMPIYRGKRKLFVNI